MRHRNRPWVFFLLFAFLLFHSCENNDYYSNESENLQSLLILEAREYFEEYASIEMEDEPTGLHPGNIAPEWVKAQVFVQPGTLAINVPLVTEATYEGSFYSGDDTIFSEIRDTYFTAMLQKLIVVKDLQTDIYSCYIATIIPSEERATKNSSKIDKMFYSGDPASEFSGIVVYSTVTTNYTISVEKYTNGVLYEQKSMFYASANHNDDLNEMSRLMGSSRLKRNVRVLTKNSEYGGDGSIWLPEVVIKPTPTPTPTPPPSLPPPYIPPTNPWGGAPDPPYYPPGYIPPTPPPTTGGGSGSGGSQQYPLPKLSCPAPGEEVFEDLTARVNEILPEIYKKLKELGIDLTKYRLKIAMGCASSARKEADGSIGICIKFIDKRYTIEDQTSIIWHEIYHVNNDKICSMDEQKLPFPINYSNITSDIERYIKNVELSWCKDYPTININDEYSHLITTNYIQHPQYYRNEIAAYQAEIDNGINISSEYAKERAYLLWVNQQKLTIADKYYNK